MPKATSVQNFKGVGRGLEIFFRGVRPFSSVRPLGTWAYVSARPYKVIPAMNG